MSKLNRQQAPAEGAAQRTGLNVFVILAVLTIVEYIVAVTLDSTVLLVALLSVAALAKCWAIVTYFMHIARLWRGEEAH
ncbi:MAG: cytochrome C oxidase subunit IV family protein [Dehalococcoidia bacterium]